MVVQMRRKRDTESKALEESHILTGGCLTMRWSRFSLILDNSFILFCGGGTDGMVCFWERRSAASVIQTVGPGVTFAQDSSWRRGLLVLGLRWNK